MKQFKIWKKISNNSKFNNKMEVAVLIDRNGQQVSVGRHIHAEHGCWIGRHPDYYDGVDAVNESAESAVVNFDGEVQRWTSQVNQLTVDLSKNGIEAEKKKELKEDLEHAKFMASEAEQYLNNAKQSLADVQREFPRIVEYI